ncbi:MAG: hypothetical protein DI568_00595 [Sphingomonas sp.]|nr:MAG: hypothetical protein DI568_00595 [Sphingomonas sp.]
MDERAGDEPAQRMGDKMHGAVQRRFERGGLGRDIIENLVHRAAHAIAGRCGSKARMPEFGREKPHRKPRAAMAMKKENAGGHGRA